MSVSSYLTTMWMPETIDGKSTSLYMTMYMETTIGGSSNSAASSMSSAMSSAMSSGASTMTMATASTASAATATAATVTATVTDSSSDGMMQMNTFMTKSYKDYPVVFEKMQAHNAAQAFGIFCVIFFSCFAYKGFTFLQTYLDTQVWNKCNDEVCPDMACSNTCDKEMNVAEDNCACGPDAKVSKNTLETEANCACDPAQDDSCVCSDEAEAGCADCGEKKAENCFGDSSKETSDCCGGTTTDGTIGAPASAPARQARTTASLPVLTRRKSSPWRKFFFPGPGETGHDVVRLLISFLSAMFGYFLMLAAMTYIWVYFMAICLGLAFAELFYHRVKVCLGINANDSEKPCDLCG